MTKKRYLVTERKQDGFVNIEEKELEEVEVMLDKLENKEVEKIE